MKIFCRVSLIMLAVSSPAFSSADKTTEEFSFDDKFERAIIDTVNEAISAQENNEESSYGDSLSNSDSDSDSLAEDTLRGLFFENLSASFHSEEVNELKKFYMEYVQGFDDEYKKIMKEMASSLGLDVNGIASLNFDMLLAIDNDNWIKSINLLMDFPQKLIEENQKRIFEYYRETKDYDSSKYQELLNNLAESDFEKLPSVIRDLIEFSKSKLDSDYSEGYLSYLKASWLVSQKSKVKQEEVEKLS